MIYDEQLRPGRGRCAIAARRVAAGTRVLQTRALAAISVTHCAVCFAPGDKQLRRCGGCKRLRYCSITCQQRDWRDGGHARECRAWSGIPNSVENAALQTLLLVARLAAAGALALPEVAQLRAHAEDHAPTKLQQFREMAVLVRSLLPGGDDAPLVALDALVTLFCRVNCNAFTICDDACMPVGVGVFPRGALFNHSCAPNCVVSFAGQDMHVHAIADVALGDELTISYVELLEATATRQRTLRESYFFDCECQRCASAGEDDWYLDGFACPSSGSLRCGVEGVVVFADADDATASCKTCGAQRTVPHHHRALKAESDEIDRLLHARPARRDAWELLQRQQELLTTHLALHPRNARVAKLHRDIGAFLMDTDAAGAAADAGRREATALEMFTRELCATEWVLPAAKLPARGLLHFQLGQLVFRRDASATRSRRRDLERAMTHFQHALAILSVAYGPENAVVRNIRAHLEEASWTARDELA